MNYEVFLSDWGNKLFLSLYELLVLFLLFLSIVLSPTSDSFLWHMHWSVCSWRPRGRMGRPSADPQHAHSVKLPSLRLHPLRGLGLRGHSNSSLQLTMVTGLHLCFTSLNCTWKLSQGSKLRWCILGLTSLFFCLLGTSIPHFLVSHVLKTVVSYIFLGFCIVHMERQVWSLLLLFGHKSHLYQSLIFTQCIHP